MTLLGINSNWPWPDEYSYSCSRPASTMNNAVNQDQNTESPEFMLGGPWQMVIRRGYS